MSLYVRSSSSTSESFMPFLRNAAVRHDAVNIRRKVARAYRYRAAMVLIDVSDAFAISWNVMPSNT